MQDKDILESKRLILRCKDLVVIPEGFAPHIFHVGSSHDLHSIITSGLIAGGKDGKQGRQTVFCRAVKPKEEESSRSSAIPGVPITIEEQSDEENCDMSRPSVAPYRNHWKVHQNAVYWVHLATVQKLGLVFYQTGSNAIIHYISVPTECITKVMSTKSKDVLFEKVRLTPRPQPRIVLKTARRTQQEEELAARVQERRETGGVTAGQGETETPVEKEKFARKKGDKQGTRSVEEHRETCGANQDLEATVSPGEEYRETCGEKEAQLEPTKFKYS